MDAVRKTAGHALDVVYEVIGGGAMILTGVPLTRAEVAAFVEQHHRHHKPAQGDKYRIGCKADGVLVGVVQVGRPVNRTLDDGTILEVTRLCTTGTDNVCSFLYSRAARVARELGYDKIITYILDTESGASLKAAGWRKEADTKGHTWSGPSRTRVDKAPTCDKQRWARKL